MLQLYSFDSGYSLVVLEEGGGGIREDQILQFHSFLSLLISCLYLSYLTLNSCFVFVLLSLLILYLLILDVFIFDLKSVNDI